MGINGVYGCLNEFLLQMAKLSNIVPCLLNLNTWISRDNTYTGTWGIKETSIHDMATRNYASTILILKSTNPTYIISSFIKPTLNSSCEGVAHGARRGGTH